MTYEDKIKIAVADSDKLMLDGLGALFEKEDGIDVVGFADDLKTGIQIVCKTQPDVFIVDPKITSHKGVELFSQVRNEKSDIRIIALSSFFSQEIFRAAREANITGLVLKRSPFDELAEAVRVVKTDETFLCAEVKRLFAAQYLNYLQNGTSKGPVHLTETQLTVVQLLASGKGTKEIANQLGKSPKTIDACRRKIMDKLGLNSLAELVKYAIRMGLSEL